jgi:small subunit ribosomal protein S4
MRYTGPKAKKVRRQGVNLFGPDKYDKILTRKPYGPGKGPKAQTGKLSEYGKQLLEKQKARDMYGLSEHQFQRLYKEATQVTGQTGEAFKQLLERRLDNTVFRAGFAMTRMQARQFVGHGLFTVDGVRVTIPSIRVKPGQVIAVRTQSKDSPMFAQVLGAHDKYAAPTWLTIDRAAMKITVKDLPGAEHGEQAIDVRKIVEFYSRN